MGPATAAELVEASKSEDIRSMVELFDWYNSNGQPRGPGFLVNSIKNPDGIAKPAGFTSSADMQTRREANIAKAQTRRSATHEKEQAESQQRAAELERFERFWESLSSTEQKQFEESAVDRADRLKRQGYYRAMGHEDAVHEQYRQIILLEHFLRAAHTRESAA